MKLIKKLQERFSKPLLLLMAVCLSLIVVLGSTFAWIKFTDDAANRVSAGHNHSLSVKVGRVDTPGESGKLEEHLDPTIISPNISDEKNIVFQNTSDVPVFIRVSVNELLLSFELDAERDDLKEYPGETATIKLNDSSTWEETKFFQVKSDSKDAIYKAKKLTKSAYNPAEASKRDADLACIEPEFINQAESGLTKGDWYFSNGYYYYLKKLGATTSQTPSDTTEILLKAIKAKADTKNALKGSLYGQEFKVEAVRATKAGITSFGISEKALSDKLANEIGK